MQFWILCLSEAYVWIYKIIAIVLWILFCSQILIFGKGLSLAHCFLGYFLNSQSFFTILINFSLPKSPIWLFSLRSLVMLIYKFVLYIGCNQRTLNWKKIYPKILINVISCITNFKRCYSILYKNPMLRVFLSKRNNIHSLLLSEASWILRVALLL